MQGVWDIDRPELVRVTSKGDADHEAFRANSTLALQVAHELVSAHLPETLHNEILEATSILDGLAHLNEYGEEEH